MTGNGLDSIDIAGAPRRNDRIVIVGGGPAGIHMAHLLRSRGYGKATVLEAEDRVGGKSRTRVVNGYPHELGACYLNFTYRRLLDLLKELGRDDAVPVPPPLRSVARAGQEDTVPVLAWMREAMTETRPGPAAALMADFAGAIGKYQAMYDEIHPAPSFNLPASALPSASGVASQTVAEFLGKNSLEVLHTVFHLYNALNGYGVASHIPVYYGTYWTNPTVLGRMAAAAAGQVPAIEPGLEGARLSGMSMLEGGFESIWRELAERSAIDVRLESKVTRVVRPGELEPERSPITVHYLNAETPQCIDCDFLIFAIPGRRALSVLDSPAPHERDAFEQQIASKLVTTLIEGPTRLAGHGLVYWPQHLDVDRADKIYAIRETSAILQGDGSGAGAEAYVLYQYYENADSFDAGRSLAGLNRFLAEHATTDTKIHERREWDYFPRFTSEAIRAGKPWSVIRNEGALRTWFIGSSVCFESVEAVLDFNHFIMDRLDRTVAD